MALCCRAIAASYIRSEPAPGDPLKCRLSIDFRWTSPKAVCVVSAIKLALSLNHVPALLQEFLARGSGIGMVIFRRRARRHLHVRDGSNNDAASSRKRHPRARGWSEIGRIRAAPLAVLLAMHIRTHRHNTWGEKHQCKACGKNKRVHGQSPWFSFTAGKAASLPADSLD